MKSIKFRTKPDCTCIYEIPDFYINITSFFSFSFSFSLSFFSPPPSTFSLFFSSSFFHRWEKGVQANKIQKADLSLLQIHSL